MLKFLKTARDNALSVLGAVALALTVGAMTTAPAMALDITAATTAIGEADTATKTIAMAVFAVVAGIAAIKWLRRAL